MFKKLIPISCCFAVPVYAVPIVPNFQQGVLQQRVETKSIIKEDIKSYDINSGFQITVGGHNIESTTGNLTPDGWTKVNTNVSGTGTTYVSPNLDNMPEFRIVESGADFSHYISVETPGISNFTHIIRETSIESISESTSTFSQ
tara:strand:+ start:74 stop:505 length:432 start_codon:yes stop_codon:yes gene_type:complete